MNDEKFLEKIIEDFTENMTIKFLNGVKEHGGKLWEKGGLLKEIKEELLDCYAYICAIEYQNERHPKEENEQL